MRDRDDITQAVATHSNTVLRVCSLYFGIRPEREDAFQETFLKYAQSPKQFADDEHRKAWLISVATNVCKDMLKRAEARTVLADEIDEAARPSWQPEDDAASGRAEELTEALQKLDARYRDVLYLKYYACYPASEIAKILNVPENTVYTNLARGREKLKEVLTRER
ncbi:MAG: sigma-70 family RNA polymerase sigma factor [Eggerthellaceae bacterium]|nr:sigma-70 family RNA polymerase sigma factor [Eggerthellaceae bacterium]